MLVIPISKAQEAALPLALRIAIYKFQEEKNLFLDDTLLAHIDTIKKLPDARRKLETKVAGNELFVSNIANLLNRGSRL